MNQGNGPGFTSRFTGKRLGFSGEGIKNWIEDMRIRGELGIDMERHEHADVAINVVDSHDREDVERHRKTRSIKSTANSVALRLSTRLGTKNLVKNKKLHWVRNHGITLLCDSNGNTINVNTHIDSVLKSRGCALGINDFTVMEIEGVIRYIVNKFKLTKYTAGEFKGLKFEPEIIKSFSESIEKGKPTDYVTVRDLHILFYGKPLSGRGTYEFKDQLTDFCKSIGIPIRYATAYPNGGTQVRCVRGIKLKNKK